MDGTHAGARGTHEAQGAHDARVARGDHKGRPGADTSAAPASRDGATLSAKARTHLLERLGVLLVDAWRPSAQAADRQLALRAALTADARLEAYGYRLDVASIEALAGRYAAGLLADPAAEAARLHFVPDVAPMYPDFPTQVMSMDQAAYRLHQARHYASTYGVEGLWRELGVTAFNEDGQPRDFARQGFLPDVPATEKTRQDRTLRPAQVISLAFSAGECAGIAHRRLLGRRERMTDADLALLAELPLPAWLVGEEPSEYPAEPPAHLDIPFRENAYLIVEMLHHRTRGQGVGDFVRLARRVCRHPGDVVKYVLWRRSIMSDRQHFPTSLRRRLVALLESFDPHALAENAARSREQSLRALELLSYARFSRSPEHMRVVSALRDGALPSWESTKERAYRQARASGDYAPVLRRLSQRPGVLLREVGRLVGLGVPERDILAAFDEGNGVGSVSTATLLTALARVDADETLERRRRQMESRLTWKRANALLGAAREVRRAHEALERRAFASMYATPAATPSPSPTASPHAGPSQIGGQWVGGSPLTPAERDLVSRLRHVKTQARHARQTLLVMQESPKEGAGAADDGPARDVRAQPGVATPARDQGHGCARELSELALDRAHRQLDEADGEVDALVRANTDVLGALAARASEAWRATEGAARTLGRLIEGLRDEQAPLHPETRELLARAHATLQQADEAFGWDGGPGDHRRPAAQNRWALMGLAIGQASCDLEDARSLWSAYMQECGNVVGDVDMRMPDGAWELARPGAVIDEIGEISAAQIRPRTAALAKSRHEAARILQELLARRLAQLDTPLRGRRVYVDEGPYDLARSTIMANVTRATSSLFAPGMAMRIPEQMRRVRFFVLWDDRGQRVDLDLHATTDTGAHVGWNGRFDDCGMTTSGDVTTSESSVEYLDVDLAQAAKAGVGSVTLTLDCYRGGTFDQVAQAFTGLLGVDDIAPDVSLYTSANVLMRNDLADVRARRITLCRIDVRNRCVIPLMGGTVPAHPPLTAQRYLETLLSAQNATRVECREEADVALAVGRVRGQGRSEGQGLRELSLIDEGWFAL